MLMMVFGHCDLQTKQDFEYSSEAPRLLPKPRAPGMQNSKLVDLNHPARIRIMLSPLLHGLGSWRRAALPAHVLAAAGESVVGCRETDTPQGHCGKGNPPNPRTATRLVGTPSCAIQTSPAGHGERGERGDVLTDDRGVGSDVRLVTVCTVCVANVCEQTPNRNPVPLDRGQPCSTDTSVAKLWGLSNRSEVAARTKLRESSSRRRAPGPKATEKYVYGPLAFHPFSILLPTA